MLFVSNQCQYHESSHKACLILQRDQYRLEAIWCQLSHLALLALVMPSETHNVLVFDIQIQQSKAWQYPNHWIRNLCLSHSLEVYRHWECQEFEIDDSWKPRRGSPCEVLECAACLHSQRDESAWMADRRSHCWHYWICVPKIAWAMVVAVTWYWPRLNKSLHPLTPLDWK